VTPEEYQTELQRMEIEPRQRVAGAWMCQDPNGTDYRIPDPDDLTPDERKATIALIAQRRRARSH